MEKTYEDYVCDCCFHRLEECTCDSAPWNLIQIDKGIQEAVRELNNKAYFTKMSCEGHFENVGNRKESSVYVSFEHGSYPNSCPNGWYAKEYGKYVGIYGIIPCPSKVPTKKRTQFDTEKAERIKELNEWAKNLSFNENY